MTIEQMLIKVRSLDLPSAIPAIIQQTSYEIEALNKEQLFNYGVDSDGRKLNPKYKSNAYAREKSYSNSRPGLGQPDLFLTGQFYNGFTVSVNQSIFEVDSINSKSSKLKSQYGDKIFGLTRDNSRLYATGSIFRKELQKYITLKTGLQFT